MTGKIFVCEDCIEDIALQEVVRANAISEECDFCGRKASSPIACILSDVIDRMRYAIDQEYTDPVDELPYDGQEGGYQGNVLDGAGELFGEIDFYLKNQELYQEICGNFEALYFNRDYHYGTPEETFTSSWDHFKWIVQHQRRYTFWESLEYGDCSDPLDRISASDMMQVLANGIKHISPFFVLPAGTEMWRVQVFDKGASSHAPSRYTSPPADKSNQPNRMSPGGIPMLYTAEDFETGCAETIDPDEKRNKETTGAKFVTLISLNVLDLTKIQPPNSFFVDLNSQSRQRIKFMVAFADEVSRPIKRDERQHLEYVPTQVFTEYVRFAMQMPNGEPFHGIKYKSSRNGHTCYVLFAEQGDCLPGTKDRSRPQMVSFVDGSLRTVEL